MKTRKRDFFQKMGVLNLKVLSLFFDNFDDRHYRLPFLQLRPKLKKLPVTANKIVV